MRDKDAHLMMEGMYQVQPNQLEQEPRSTREDPGQVAGVIVQTLKRIYDEFRTLRNQPPGEAYAILQKYIADPTTVTDLSLKDKIPSHARAEDDIANALKGTFTTGDQGIQFKN
tara:strand:- start:1141 stop:1482 length:342 start_codon:yes stop_codon:yes gene_type:complete